MRTVEVSCDPQCEGRALRQYWSQVLSEYAEEYLSDIKNSDHEAYVYAQGIQDAAAIVDPEWNQMAHCTFCTSEEQP